MSLVKVPSLDSVTSFFASMPGLHQRATNSALSSIGYKLKAEAKSAVNSNAFGWPKISQLAVMTRKYPAVHANHPNRVSSSILAREAVTSTATKKIWGSLAGLLVYSLEKDEGKLLFGFSAGTYGTRKGYKRSDGTSVRVANIIGQNVIDIAKRLTEGFQYQVGVGPRGDAQRRYFAALGFIVMPGRTFTIPARPLIGPVFVMSRPMIPTWFRDKFWERLRFYNSASAAFERAAA